MFSLKKNLTNQNGLTLIELLATLVLLVIISVFAFSVLSKSLETTQAIKLENSLRDEADLIVSKFIKVIYRTKQLDVFESLNKNNDNNYLINVSSDRLQCIDNVNSSSCITTLKKNGFVTTNGVTKIYIDNEEYVLSNRDIIILPSSKISKLELESSETVYKLELALEIPNIRGGKNPKKMVFENNIQTINNDLN